MATRLCSSLFHLVFSSCRATPRGCRGFAVSKSPKWGQTSNSTEIMEDKLNTFLYFAYGSNMLTKRIHINNPTAKQKYIGTIKDHRLDFIRYSENWHGCAATIVPDSGHEVWGVVWEIDMINLPNLDEQEGVSCNIYFPKNVTVHTSSGEQLECRVYQQCQLPESYIKPDLLPPDRQPSSVYLNTAVTGAIEFKIPGYYVDYLKSFKHNGYDGPTGVFKIDA